VEAIIDADHDWDYIAQRKTNFHLLLNITPIGRRWIAQSHSLLYNRLQPAYVCSWLESPPSRSCV